MFWGAPPPKHNLAEKVYFNPSTDVFPSEIVTNFLASGNIDPAQLCLAMFPNL